MNNKEFEKMMEQKRIESEKPGYSARCAAKAREVNKSRKGDQNAQELILS